jgi:hypothetical protein
MNSQAVFIYILKAILVSGIFLAYYWVALRNKKNHQFNRFYLLFSLVLSIIIPLFQFSWITIDKPVIYGSDKIIEYLAGTGTTAVAPDWNWMDMLLIAVAVTALVFLVQTVIHICRIYRIKKHSTVTRMETFDLIDTEDESAPFSFLNNLFWKPSLSPEQEEGRKIWKHELTHIRQNHSLDRLFCQLLCSTCWMNPFYWLIQKELAAIHEFIADEEAIADADPESLARMLLKAHYGDHFLPTTQSFFYSSIKRRLIMLTLSNNKRYGLVKKLIALPLLVLILGIFSFQVKDSTYKPATAVTPGPDKTEKLFVVAQEPARFPGGEQSWQQFLQKNLNEDIVSKKGGPPGKYAVQLSFIVNKEGEISEVKALTDPGYGTKEEALRVMSKSPRWIPAEQNGKKVIYRNKISITFVVLNAAF